MIYAVAALWAWTTAVQLTRVGPTGGLEVAYVGLTVLLAWMLYHRLAFHRVDGRPAQVVYSHLLDLGFVPVEVPLVAGFGNGGMFVLMVRGDADPTYLLSHSAESSTAFVSCGHLADPFTFEEHSSWRVTAKDGQALIPRSLLAQLRSGVVD